MAGAARRGTAGTGEVPGERRELRGFAPLKRLLAKGDAWASSLPRRRLWGGRWLVPAVPWLCQDIPLSPIPPLGRLFGEAGCGIPPKGCSDAAGSPAQPQWDWGVGAPIFTRRGEVPACRAVLCRAVPCRAVPCRRWDVWGCGWGRELLAERGWGHCCRGRDAEEGCDVGVPMGDV